MSSARCSNAARRSGRRMPSVIAQTNTAMKPLPPAAVDRDAVDRERRAERVQRRGALAVRRHARAPASQPQRDAERRARASRPGARTATTRSRRSSPSAAANASTAGSASPSLSPDSRLSEWRTSRGTRGLVTTEEESTGSVGESSAPSRHDSSQPSPTIQCAATATIDAGDRHRRARACAAAGATRAGASRPRPRARRGTGSRPARRSPGRARTPSAAPKSSTSRPPSPSTKPATTNTRRERQERAPREPGQQRAAHQQAAEDEQRDRRGSPG